MIPCAVSARPTPRPQQLHPNSTHCQRLSVANEHASQRTLSGRGQTTWRCTEICSTSVPTFWALCSLVFAPCCCGVGGAVVRGAGCLGGIGQQIESSIMLQQLFVRVANTNVCFRCCFVGLMRRCRQHLSPPSASPAHPHTHTPHAHEQIM